MLLNSTLKAFMLSLFFFVITSQALAQNITTVAGTLKTSCPAAPCGDGGLASDAQLYSPSGLAVDPFSNVYIAEYSNHSVRVIDHETGNITTFAGAQRTPCITAPCGDGGLAVNALLNGPRGVASDADGNIYIADFSNHAIRKIDIATGIITTVAGTIRSSCSTVPCGDGGLATDARLSSPTGLFIDPDGNLFIADYGNHVIRKVDKTTGIITTIAGTMKTSCAAAPCGDAGPATSAFFSGPSGVAVDSEGNIYVVEYGNHAVRKIDNSTGIISTYAGNLKQSCPLSPCGDGGSATGPDAKLTSPFALTLDQNENVIIADASNAAVRKVDRITGIITTIAGITKSSCIVLPCGEAGLATSAQLSNPFAVQFSPDYDTLYILEYSNHAVRMVSPMGGMSILPVTMSQLQATRKGSVIEISWQSSNESNVDRYEIERSTSSNQFRKEGVVAANGNETSIFYNWNDHNPAKGNNQYRIKSVDRDGKISYSRIVNVNMETSNRLMTISPNPVTGKSLQVQLSAIPIGQAELVLFNHAGQKVYSKTITTTGTPSSVTIELPSNISIGMYSLYLGNEKMELGREKIFIQ